jgi:alkylation response protein AidB-like acyl-CoA dehydrogenase
MTRTPEQVELATTVRSLLTRRADTAAIRAAMASPTGYDAALWQLLCDQIGAAALPIPEELGGAGFTLGDALVVAEEVGYSLAPTPLLSSLVTSAALLTATIGGDPAGAELLSIQLLRRIAAGEVAAIAWAGPDRATAAGPEPVTYAGGRLTGTVSNVLEGDQATVLVVAASAPDGVSLFSVDPSAVDRTWRPAMDPTLRLATVTFDATPATLLVADAGAALEAAHRAGCLTVAALQVGAARRGLEMTVAYSKERVQFGRPIGSFQALKHRMADLLVRVEMARSALDAAAEDDAEDALLHAAASYCSDALRQVAAETVQLHGGIAITWEHDAQLVFKRAHALGQLFGQPHQHRALIEL